MKNIFGKLINKKILHEYSSRPKIFSLLSLCLSCLYALAGFTILATEDYITENIYGYLFLILGICFLATGISSIKINKKKSIRILGFSLILFLIVFLSTAYPSSLSLQEYGLSASLTYNLMFSIGLIIFGLIGASLSLGVLFNFKALGNQYGAYFLLVVCMLIILYPLVIIVGQVTINGAPGITWEFLTSDVRGLGESGGVLPAIVGTLLLMVIMFFIAVPLGIGAAIYLQEYAGGHFMVRVIKMAVTILRGVPSIVFGLFALAFFVPLFGTSFLTGGLVLSFYALPMIIRSSAEALKSIPQSLREGSLALGATKWQTIKKVVLPPSLPGIITGVVLGIGEAAGETAPLLFVSTLIIKMPPNLMGMVASLPTHLFTLFGLRGGLGDEIEVAARMQNAWSTAFILLTIILILNVVALIIREKFRKEF